VTIVVIYGELKLIQQWEEVILMINYQEEAPEPRCEIPQTLDQVRAHQGSSVGLENVVGAIPEGDDFEILWE